MTILTMVIQHLTIIILRTIKTLLKHQQIQPLTMKQTLQQTIPIIKPLRQQIPLQTMKQTLQMISHLHQQIQLQTIKHNLQQIILITKIQVHNQSQFAVVLIAN